MVQELASRAPGTLDAAVARYLAATPLSQQLNERSLRSIPGGSSRSTVFYEPYPFFVDRGEGCRVYDVDGNARIDFINRYSSLILGHAHPRVVEAVSRQVQRGSVYAAPVQVEVDLAEAIKQRVPSVDRIRFTNSGTEATMMALRVARAFTGRDRFAKFEGGFHGSHDAVEVSTKSSPQRAGPADEPRSVPNGPGLPASVADNVVILPFNHPEAVIRLVERHAGTLAAIMVEPVGRGIMAPRDGFLQTLRDLADRFGIVLIFDEVVSFRVAYGGAQARYGVRPDLTTFGKIVGGGFPVGAFGGRADIMELFNPRFAGERVDHGGTFNANPVTMAAGVATLGELPPGAFERLEATMEELAEGLEAIFRRRQVAAQLNRVGSVFNLHFTPHDVFDYRTLQTVDARLAYALHLGLLNQGIFFSPRGLGSISTPMGHAEIEAFTQAVDRVLQEIL